jgi:hypothetical protein
MKKLFMIGLVTFLAATAWADPKVTFPNSPWDFGEMLQQQKASHQFEIHNAGTDTLFISSVKPSCGCTSAPLTKDVVAPGESIWLDVTFDSKRFSGTVNKSVVVFCNDAENPRPEIVFSARIETARKLITVAPEPTDLGNLLPGKPDQAKVTFTNTGSEPYRLSVLDWPKNWMKLSWTEKVVDPNRSIDLRVGTSSSAPMGSFSASLTLDVQGAQTSRMSVPLTGIGLVE